MNKLLLALAVVGALVLAGCASNDDENVGDGNGGSNGGRGSQVEGTLEAVDPGTSNETEPQLDNSTNETGST